MTTASSDRPANCVRVMIQDYASMSAKPAPRVTDIPITQGFAITPETARGWRRWIRHFVRRNGPTMAIVGTALLARQVMRAHGLEEQHFPLVMGAITSAVATSFKGELGTATHDFTITTGNVVKCALYTSTATLGAATTAYSATNEISGTGYSAGGVTMANATPVTSGTTAIFDWADAQWTSSSFTANGCLVYNSTKSNKAIFVIAFGSDQTVTSGTFTVQWPTADASNAIIRIA